LLNSTAGPAEQKGATKPTIDGYGGLTTIESGVTHHASNRTDPVTGKTINLGGLSFMEYLLWHICHSIPIAQFTPDSGLCMTYLLTGAGTSTTTTRRLTRSTSFSLTRALVGWARTHTRIEAIRRLLVVGRPSLTRCVCRQAFLFDVLRREWIYFDSGSGSRAERARPDEHRGHCTRPHHGGQRRGQAVGGCDQRLHPRLSVRWGSCILYTGQGCGKQSGAGYRGVDLERLIDD
jgi:hypothetical protein